MYPSGEIDTKFIYHFVDPDLGVEVFFEKEGVTEKGGVDFEIRDWGNFAHLVVLGLKKISCRACLLFNFIFFGDKKYLLKALLTCTSIH